MTDPASIPPPKRWSQRPRLKGFDYVGTHAYHLVFSTSNHARVLTGSLAEDVVASLNTAARDCAFELLTFTVMPDHVHVLVQATGDAANVIRFAQRAKQRPGFLYKRETGKQLWLPSFYDRIVRRGDDAREIAAYILLNPVRAGLMSDGDAWPYSGGSLIGRDGGRS